MAANRRFILSIVLALATLASSCMAAIPPDTELAEARREMVEDIRARGVKDAAVRAAVGSVPRHLFIPEAEIPKAEIDFTLVDGQVVYERGRSR